MAQLHTFERTAEDQASFNRKSLAFAKGREGAFARWCCLGVLMSGLLGVGSTQAQVFYAGPKVAYQTVWILNQNNYGLSEMDYELTGGLAYGLSLGVDWSEHWGMQFEFQFAHQGQDYRDNIGLQLILGVNDVFDVGKTVDLRYGQVPLLVRYRGGGEGASFLGLLGPQFGFRGAAEMRYTVDSTTLPVAVLPGALYPDLLTADDFFQSIDFGLAGGAGLEWTMGEYVYGRLMARFYLGLTDINAGPTRGAPEYGASRNASLGAELGFGVRIPSNPSRGWSRQPGR